jgi:hypothetical protein
MFTAELTTAVARLQWQLLQHLSAACTLNKILQALLATFFKIPKFRQHYVQCTARPTLLFIEHNSAQRDVPINKITLKSYVHKFKWNLVNKLFTGHSVTSTTNKRLDVSASRPSLGPIQPLV